MLPPQSATLTVAPMDRDSRAVLAVRTLAYVALRIPRMHTTLLMQAPRIKVMPLVASTNSENAAAITTTTMLIVLNSVFRNMDAPLRIIAAISIISAVPSFIFLMRKKLKAM